MEVWLLAVVIISLMQVNVQNYKRHLCYSFSLLFASLVCFVCFFATLVTRLSLMVGQWIFFTVLPPRPLCFRLKYLNNYVFDGLQ